MATMLSAVGAGEIFPSDLRPAEAHVVQFYTDNSVLLDGLGASLGNALIAGESVVAVLTKAHDKGLRRRLLARNIDVEKASKDGRLTVMDAVEALKLFMTASGPNRQKFLRQFGSIIRTAQAAAGVRNKRVVVFGEMVAVLWKQKKYDSAILLEQLWNELAKTQFFFLRCAYPAKGFRGAMKGEPYHTICAEHSVVFPA